MEIKKAGVSMTPTLYLYLYRARGSMTPPETAILAVFVILVAFFYNLVRNACHSASFLAETLRFKILVGYINQTVEYNTSINSVSGVVGFICNNVKDSLHHKGASGTRWMTVSLPSSSFLSIRGLYVSLCAIYRSVS